MATDKDLWTRVREARRRFVSMAATYALGVYNDNFFKQAILLLLVEANLTHLQGYATVVFTLPFILFAAPAGWAADRYSKRTVIIGAKVLELLAMLAGAVGVYYLNWPLVFVMLFLMALQSTIFSPALNGSIPELYPAPFVPTANARVRAVVTAAILLGIAMAGYMLDVKLADDPAFPYGRWLVALAVVAVAFVGVAVSLGVPRYPAADPKAPFPWYGPADTIRVLARLRSIPLLFVSIMADTFFWFIASLQVQVINVLGLKELLLTKSGTSGLVVAQLVGIALGGFLATRISKGDRWHRVVAPALYAMACGMALVFALPWMPAVARMVAAYTCLAGIGIAGGVFLIPVESFIQMRPAAREKGTVWSATNFATFVGIGLSGPIYLGFDHLGLAATSVFGLMAVVTVAAAAAVNWILRSIDEAPA